MGSFSLVRAHWARAAVAVLVGACSAAIAGSSPALAYNLTGARWANVTSDLNSIIDETYPGIGTAWDDATQDWNTTATKVYITRDLEYPSTVKLYSTDYSGVAWDGQTTWTSPTITETTSYLNHYYTQNYSAATTKGVAGHELGHALGLAHETGCVLMVDNTPAREACGVTAPTADDINGVNDIYGPLLVAGPAGVHMDVSWAQQYSSLADMARDADAIVVGSAKAVVGRSAPEEGLAFTDFSYTVDQWVSTPGKTVERPHAIVIHQTGGTTNGRLTEVSDDPLLVPGEGSMLFLRQYAPGKYFVLGGPTGRLLRQGTQLAQLSGASSLDGLSMSQTATIRAVKLALAAGPSKSVAVTER